MSGTYFGGSSEVIKGKNGLLANYSESWYKQIKKLIDDKDLRKKMGEEAFKTTKDHWQMKDHIKDYAKFFIDAVK